MKINDLVAVVGLKNRSTELAEALCRSFGIDVFYAVKKSDPTQRIASVEEESVVTASFDQLAPEVCRLGLMASDKLYDRYDLDCNLTSEREMFGHLLCWVAHRITSEDDLPDGWRLLNTAIDPYHKDFDPLMQSYPKGTVLSSGKVVVTFGSDKRLLQIPEDYADIFPLLEGCRV